MAIKINPKNKGLLHKKMGVDPKKKISLSALEKEKSSAKKHGDTKTEKEANFAIVAKTKFHHKNIKNPTAY